MSNIIIVIIIINKIVPIQAGEKRDWDWDWEWTGL